MVMTSRVITTEHDRAVLLKLIGSHKLPFTCDIKKGKHRTVEQNRLQRLWVQEASEQLGEHTPEECRAFCKAYFGVPILLAENEHFREQYEKHVKPLPYEQKLALMAEPLDLPVTRLMTTSQKTRYLDAVFKHFSERGVELTRPDEMGRAA